MRPEPRDGPSYKLLLRNIPGITNNRHPNHRTTEVHLTKRIIAHIRAPYDPVLDQAHETDSNLLYAGDEGGVACHSEVRGARAVLCRACAVRMRGTAGRTSTSTKCCKRCAVESTMRQSIRCFAKIGPFENSRSLSLPRSGQTGRTWKRREDLITDLTHGGGVFWKAVLQSFLGLAKTRISKRSLS
jgi:hypothetical protein